MQILHLSTECYPAAKVGGLGDVVGALPKYLTKAGMTTGVIIPKYENDWIKSHSFSTVYSGSIRLHTNYFPFSIEKEKSGQLGFPFFVVNIKGLLDRPGIYADMAGNNYPDEVERYLCFQQAVLQWIRQEAGKPQLLHCHDHHTGLVPFMIRHCPEYQELSHIPTVFTIHNGRYQGAFGWEKMYMLPFFEDGNRGLLDWQNAINPLATAIKCAWRITTVSPTYLEELRQEPTGIENLLAHERHKSLGIINGIDTQNWNPASDSYLPHLYKGDLPGFKAANKSALQKRLNFDPKLPLITFIGRLVREKGADLIPDLLKRVLNAGLDINFILLGTGDSHLMNVFSNLEKQFPNRFFAVLEYNEALAHQLYAGSDFLFMPSRVEPCGLNQLYAMRYAAIPIVRTTGGLKDTVPDIGIGSKDEKGRGIRFDHFNLEDAQMAIYRASELYRNTQRLNALRERIFALDFSWERSAEEFIQLYKQML